VGGDSKNAQKIAHFLVKLNALKSLTNICLLIVYFKLINK